MRLEILTRKVFKSTSQEDPLNYYYNPLTKKFYFGRLAVGLDLLKEKKYHRVLEIGYGSGILLPTLAGLCEELYGIDIHPYNFKIKEQLKKRNVHCNLIEASIYSIPFDSDFFDLIVIFSVLEHLKDLPKALPEVKRVLRNNGEILIGVPRLDKLMNCLFIIISYFKANKVHIVS